MQNDSEPSIDASESTELNGNAAETALNTDASAPPSIAGTSTAGTSIAETSQIGSSQTSLLTDDDESTNYDDSAFGSSTSSVRSASLTSSVYDYEYTHGRRYHSNKSSEYGLPNDEREQDRLDLQHLIFLHALNGRYYSAPLPEDQLRNVLDVGCGTGIWCIELADLAPNATVEGFDISPIQPGWVPPNCQFYVDDCNGAWESKGKFNLIHTRALTLGVKDWSRFFGQAYEALIPGGYIDCQEYIVPFHCRKSPSPETTAGLVQWGNLVAAAVEKLGYTLGAAVDFERLLKNAGFEDVTVKLQDWPVGRWAKGDKNKQLGRMTSENFKDGIRNSIKMFTGMLGWTKEEFEVFSAKTAKEIDSPEYHLWTQVVFVSARKPT